MRARFVGLLVLGSLAVISCLKAQSPTPSISSLTPPTTTAGALSFTLTIDGANFVPPSSFSNNFGSTVAWIAGNTFASLDVISITATNIQVSVPSSLLTTPVVATIRVSNPNESSASTSFQVNQRPVILSTSPLPNGTVGVTYSFVFESVFGTSPVTWTTTGGILPPGLTLSPNGGLSGTPLTAGQYGFVAILTDSAGVSTRSDFSITISPPPLVIGTVSPLPDGTVGAAYSTTLLASGGTPPYVWLTSDTLPPGLRLFTNGTFSGTPTAAGTYSFTGQLSDAGKQSASRLFTVTIKPPALQITTVSPLSAGTVGSPYSATLTATGGTPPYAWSSTGTLPPGLTLSAAGILSGTPTAAGPYNFTIAVKDVPGTSVSKTFALSVNPPALVIGSASPLPDGAIGANYSATLLVSGGTSPYRWSTTGSLPPGLTLASSGLLSGVPTVIGTYNFTAVVTDAANLTASKAFAITIKPAALLITTPAPLPAGTVGSAYSATFAATGGATPLAWSSTGSLPPGLSVSSAGVLSGTPSAAGAYNFNAVVTDAANSTASAAYTLTINLPALSSVSVQGLGSTADPAQQPTFNVGLASAYPVALSGVATLSFTPDAVVPVDDPAIQFSTGGRTAAFTIPAGQLAGVFSSPGIAIQTGSVAGTITMTLRLTAGAQDVTPAPAPNKIIVIGRSAPIISSVTIVKTPTGFNVVVRGFSTPRQMSQAAFHFTAAAQGNLQTMDVPVDVSSSFTQWYQNTASGAFGSSFAYTQPFTLQGDISAISSVSVTLSNSLGASASKSASF